MIAKRVEWVGRRPVPGIPGAIACRVDELPESLPESILYSPIGEIAGADLLLNAQGIGRFLVRGGDTVEYAVEAGADLVAVDRFLWGSARSALIHQRGELPLHASVAVAPGGNFAIALCGPSGAGKSTTAAALLRCGWTSLADDLARIVCTKGEACVWPGQPWMRLCIDACDHLAVDPTGLPRDHGDREKVLVAVPTQDRAIPLRAIIALGGEKARPELESLRGGEAMAVLAQNIVGRRKMRALHSTRQQFEIIAPIAAGVYFFRLHGRRTSSATVLARRLHETFC